MSKLQAFVSGGCGFVGRHLVAKLRTMGADILIVDDLSTGVPIPKWLPEAKAGKEGPFETYEIGDTKIRFLHADAIHFFHEALAGNDPSMPIKFDFTFHLASIVGGRATIDGDPILVATDLAIDALFFRWATRYRDRFDRILYASSSAAYPVDLQTADKGAGALQLKEDMIELKGRIGKPDMTYGWSKLTGEYLATIAAERCGLKIASIRPFSGFGEDQDLSYPVPAIALRVANRENPLEVWGTGKQGRDFIHIDDCVEAMFYLMDHVTDGSGINVGMGRLTTFLETLEMFSKLEGYSPEIKPLLDKPVGVQSRFCDPSLLRGFGWKAKISMEEGFARVLEGAHKRKRGEILY